MANDAIKQVCGVCNDEWLTEAEYLNHTCPNSKLSPTDPLHLVATTTPDFLEAQQAALVRGLQGLQDDDEDTTAQIKAIEDHAFEHDLVVPAEVL